MTDMRFIIIGILIIFSGFLILILFGDEHRVSILEINEFGSCYQYLPDKDPIEIDCSFKSIDFALFVGIVLILTVIGIASLIKGIRGNWDNKVAPDDILGSDYKKSDKD